jgi:hypothetical protein
MNDLKSLNHIMGFYPQMPRSDNFTTAGIVISDPITIHLYPKWNMIPYPSFTERNVSEALAGINYNALEEFNPNYKALGPADFMRPGQGYWIHVSYAQDWTVNP